MHIYFQEDCLWVLITHRAERRGNPQTRSTPSHGELDHGQSGARPAQLRLEIWIAPDRLHSHHPHREPGRAAATLPASKLKQKTPREAGDGLQEAGAWAGTASTTRPPGAASAESRQRAGEPRGRRRGLGGERQGQGAQHPAGTARPLREPRLSRV